MSTLHDDRIALEEGARAMLHRLAADARVDPPLWDDLTDERAGVVVPLPTADQITERGVRRAPRRNARSPRVSLAAAVVVAVAVAGALVVDRTTETSTPSTAPITLLTPASDAFDATHAPAVWATGVTDPLAAAGAYLQGTGIPAATAVVDSPATDVGASVSAPGAATLTLVGLDDATAVVEWALDGASGATGGTVYLRSTALPVSAEVGAAGGGADLAEALASQGWVVVGSSALDVSLDAVSLDGDHLAFDVARTAASSDQLAITLWVDGEPLPLGGDVVLDATGTQVLGELVDIGAGVGSVAALGLDVDVTDVVTMRVVRVARGTVVSVTQAALQLPQAAPETVTEVAGVAAATEAAAAAAAAEAAGDVAGGTGDTASDAGDAAGSAGGTVDDTATGAVGSAGEAVGGAVDGVTGAVEGLLDGVLPPLPLPEVPGVDLPVPTTEAQLPDLTP
jgi:hypothetical protein